MDTVTQHKSGQSIEDLPAILRLMSAAGPTTLTLTPEMAIQAAHDLEAGRLYGWLCADAKAAQDAAREALEAAEAAMQPIRAAAQHLPKLILRAALIGFGLGAVSTIVLLTVAGMMKW